MTICGGAPPYPMPSHFRVVAVISSDGPEAIETVLRERFPASGLSRTPEGDFQVEAVLEGASAKELNRELLSALRRAEKRTRLRSVWSGEGYEERYFDYVLKKRTLLSPA